MKKVLSFFISLFIGTGIFIWIIKVVGWQEIKSSLFIFTGLHGLVILFLSFLIILVGCFRWKLILKSQGQNLSYKQLMPLYLSCFSMNYLFKIIFIGGDIFRAYILREKHSIPWPKAVSSVIADKVLEATCFLIAILTGFAFFLFEIGLPPRNLAIILGSTLLLFISAAFFFYFKSFRKESIVKPLVKIFNKGRLPNGDVMEIERETFAYFKLRKSVFWKGLGLALFGVGVSWLRCWILLLFLGKIVGVLPAMSVLGFYYIAMIIPIPAGLGIHEAAQVFSFGALNIGTSIAPAFAMIQRGAQLILAFAGIIIFFKLGIGLFRTFVFRKIDNLIGSK